MDEEAKKTLLRTVPYGLYAATTRPPEGGHHIFILSWFTQVSFDPPLFVCGVHKEGKGYRHLSETDQAPLAVSFLGEDQQPLGQEILKKPPFDEETVAGTAFEVGKNGCALLPAALGALEARVVEEAALDGDHAAFVCEVTEAHLFRHGEPLTHANTGWHYGG